MNHDIRNWHSVRAEKLPSFACLGGLLVDGLTLHWLFLPFICLLVFSSILFSRHFGPGHFITWNLLVFYLSIICYWQIIFLKPTKQIPLTLCALIPLYFYHVNIYVDLKRTSEQGITEHGGTEYELIRPYSRHLGTFFSQKYFLVLRCWRWHQTFQISREWVHIYF